MELDKKLEKKFQFFKSQEEIEAKQNKVRVLKETAMVFGISVFLYILIFASIGSETINSTPYLY